MLDIKLSINDKALQSQIENLDGFPNRFVATVLARATVKLKQEAPADTGQLARSGRHKMTGYAAGEILFDTNYSRFVHDGRGKGGVNLFAIQDWVKSKGIDRKAAFPIARSIAKKGTRKQPWAKTFVESVSMRQVINAAIKLESSNAA